MSSDRQRRACAHSLARNDTTPGFFPYLDFGRLAQIDAEPDFVHGLLDHANGVRSLRPRVDTSRRDLGRDLAAAVLQLGAALLLADLELALLEDLEHDLVRLGRVERLLQVTGGRDGAL